MTLCSPWVSPNDLPASKPALANDGEWETICETVSDILYALSGRQWSGGGCTAVAVIDAGLPGTDRSWGGCCGRGVYPSLVDGAMVNHTCVHRESIRLPDRAVTEVTSVTVHGEVRDPSTYELLPGSYLRDKTAGGWPTCGGVTVVEYVHGTPVPPGGRIAARELALQYGMARVDAPGCQLPRRVTQVVRQGVTIGALDSFAFMRERRTGVYEVDLWLTSVNPDNKVRAAQVWSPDTNPPAIRRSV